jgi:hypothetical protein
MKTPVPPPPTSCMPTKPRVITRTLRSFTLVPLLACLAVLAFSATPALASSPPVIESESVLGITQTDTTLEARIDTGGLYTGYWFQIDTNSSYNFSQPTCPFELPGYEECEAITDGEPLPAGLVEPKPHYIPAGSGEQTVSLDLASIGATLQPDTTYHYRVIAANEGSPTVEGPDQTFTTLPAGAPVEPWVNEGAEREAKEAPRIGAEEEAKAKEEAERPGKEAAARAAKEREIREAGERAGRETAEREAKRKEAEEAAAARLLKCVVPRLKGDSVAAARSALSKAHCKLGKLSRPRGSHKPLVVTGQGAKSGVRLADGAPVAVKLGPAKRKQT